MNFSKLFTYIQEEKWYYEFLKPVINEIEQNTKVLDVGTGSGKMLELLINEKQADWIGIDTNQSMLNEAKKKLKKHKTKLIKIDKNEPLPFQNNSFDYITFCNVLFHLDELNIYNYLDNTVKLLTKNGKIIVLTPTGKGGFIKLAKHYFSFNNKGIYLWYQATKNRAGPWKKNAYIEQYSKKHKLNYEHKEILNGFAQIEIIYK